MGDERPVLIDADGLLWKADEATLAWDEESAVIRGVWRPVVNSDTKRERLGR